MVFAIRLFVLLLVATPFSLELNAQESCSVEAKLLLVPTQVEAAIPLLRATGELRARIYFYDTPSLDLLSKGLILRLREGANGDLTVKLRPLNGKPLTGSSSPPSPSSSARKGERYKCEVEITGGVEGRSYSIGTRYRAEQVPESGMELARLLSPGQKKLLEDSHVQVDWTKVKRVANIQSTSWTVRAQAPLNKFSMELWEWPRGRILEMSAKAGPDAGKAVYTGLESLAKKKGLALSAVQRSKTAMALEQMNPVPGR
jgi:hypothetical protein